MDLAKLFGLTAAAVVAMVAVLVLAFVNTSLAWLALIVVGGGIIAVIVYLARGGSAPTRPPE